MITIQVKFFGPAADQVGAHEAEYGLAEPATVASLAELIFARYPKMGEAKKSIRFAVNEEYADASTPLATGDEVAVIPPVAGGSALVELVAEPIDMNRLIEHVSDPTCGGVSTFAGDVRAERDGENVLLALEYSAYDSMALKKMHEIREEALARFDVRDVAIVHRVGRLEIGETSVAIAVGAPHRVAALEACRFAIDTLKETVPIWKKEYWSGGETSWVDPTNSGSTPPK
jgi:molybdopterin synthase catalytic subunit